MSAGLVSAKVDVTHPEVHATGASGRARSSIEVKDSCNCCKLCFPCWGRKTKKVVADPRISRIRTDTMPTPMPTQDVDSTRFAPVRKSPAYDDMSQFVHMPVQHQEQTITVNVHCDPATSTSTAALTPLSSDSLDSIGTAK